MACRKQQKRGTHNLDIRDMMVPKKRQSMSNDSNQNAVTESTSQVSKKCEGKIIKNSQLIYINLNDTINKS